MKSLPEGTRLLFRNLSKNVTEQDLQNLIVQCTGQLIPLDQISVVARESGNRNKAAISLTAIDVAEIMQWALSEGSLYGEKIKIHRPRPVGQ